MGKKALEIIALIGILLFFLGCMKTSITTGGIRFTLPFDTPYEPQNQTKQNN